MSTMETDELAQYLDALERENCYRVDAVLKESSYEVTQLVYYTGTNGTQRGPFVRKYIKRETGLGSAYQRLFAAQQSGRRFKYLPDIFECYTTGDDIVVVMEYVRGDTLQEVVYQRDPSPELARDVFPRLCDAVSELHEECDPPIVHRDLKPSNVIVSEGGLAIIDFGIAREYKEGESVDTTHFGTRSFAPPEQFGYGQTTVRSDVYALGMLLYFCLTERIPDAAARETWFLDDRIPVALRGVIAKAAAFDPAQRYASARELKAAFLKAMNPNARDSSPRQEHAIPPPLTPRGGVRNQPAPAPSVQPAIQKQRSGSGSRACAVALTILFCSASWYNLVHPQGDVASIPWFNMLSFGFVVPALCLISCFIVFDHYRERPVFPRLAKRKAWVCVSVFIVVSFIMYVLISSCVVTFTK